MQEKGHGNTLLGVAKIVLEIGALWAAFGYLSLRAFCNVSGLPLIDNVSFQRYLEETYYLFVAVAVDIATNPFFLIVLLVCCGVSIVNLFSRRRHTAQTATPPRWIDTAWLLPVWILVCTFGYAALSAYLGLLPQDLLVGKLVAAKLQDRGTGHFYLAIVLALFACSGVGLLQQRRRNRSSVAADLSRRTLFAALWLLAVLSVMNIPIFFGASLANKEIHVVRLHLDGEPGSTCVARILESPAQFLYWRAENQQGFVESVALSQIRSIDYVRSANLRDMATAALQSTQPEPQCNASAKDTK